MGTDITYETGYYIVREEWLPIESDSPILVFVMAKDPIVIFQDENDQLAKEKAERYYEDRLNYIAVKKLISIEIEKWPCILSLSYAANKEDIGTNEIVIRVINEQSGVFNQQIFKYK